MYQVFLFKQLKKFRTKEIHQIGIPIDITNKIEKKIPLNFQASLSLK